MSSHRNNLIDELAGLAGILPGYHDIKGEYHPAYLDTKIILLKAMGYDLSSEESIRQAIEYERHYPWLDIIEPVHVRTLSEPLLISLYLPAQEGQEEKIAIDIALHDEHGRMLKGQRINSVSVKEERIINNKRYVRVDYEEKDLKETGYYEIRIKIAHPDSRIDGTERDSRLIIAPEMAYLPLELKKGRCWGLSINLYSIRSHQNWGVGDFGDLKDIISWLSELGACLVAINPLHAIPNTVPFGISPYSPLSRLYRNYIYLDMSGLKEIKDLSMIESTISALREKELIDYEGVASLKLHVLRQDFRRFLEGDYKKGSPHGEEFKRYLAEESEDLELFATYMALSERFGSSDWQRWPPQYHEPEGIEVTRFREENKDLILFYKYIQWLLDAQHRGLYEHCRDKGLFIGLYHDLAIGAVRGSCDVWADKRLYCLEADLGAPPDDFSPDGQNWGFPPLLPMRLRRTGYGFFIKILRKNMRYAGALRIDHALGLFRQFWIPRGMSPSEGAYVKFPYEELLKIIALESVRNRTMIIAEDLGTIPENVREELKRYRMLSYRVFYFERNYPEPSFVKPDNYPPLSLAAITTHDLPTIYGFWKGVDIQDRLRLGKYPDQRMAELQIQERQRDRQLIIDALKKEGLLPQDYKLQEDMTEELCFAIYAYLARTRSRIVLVSLDDITGTLKQQNMPGTVDTYPNWRQKTPLMLEEIIQDRRFRKLVEVFKEREQISFQSP